MGGSVVLVEGGVAEKSDHGFCGSDPMAQIELAAAEWVFFPPSTRGDVCALVNIHNPPTDVTAHSHIRQHDPTNSGSPPLTMPEKSCGTSQGLRKAAAVVRIDFPHGSRLKSQFLHRALETDSR